MLKSLNWGFTGLLIAAFIFSYLPIINIPLTWLTTFFHEISHGLAAILTGGSIKKIILHLTGSGLCYTQGGNRFLVMVSGYIGAVMAGIVLYMMADLLNHKKTNIVALCMAGIVAFSALLWGRDILTLIIMTLLFCLFLSIVKLQETELMKWLLKFMGIYVLLDAVKAPLHLIDGKHYGDGANLADLTGIPEILWVILWLVIGLAGLWYFWKINGRHREAE